MTLPVADTVLVPELVMVEVVELVLVTVTDAEADTPCLTVYHLDGIGLRP